MKALLVDMSSQQNRRQDYKHRGGLKQEELRKKREEAQVEIRKQKRQENIAKKRQVESVQAGPDSDDNDDESVAIRLADQLENILPLMINNLYSNDPKLQLEATTEFRKLLSTNVNPPIDRILKHNIVPRLIEFLHSESSQIQLEAAWALTNIASGPHEYTKLVFDAGAVPVFINILSNGNEQICDQAVWALGNIAGDNFRFREFVLQQGALQPLLQLIVQQAQEPPPSSSTTTTTTTTTMLSNSVWTLCNLCASMEKVQPDWYVISPALPILTKLVYHHDKDVLLHACEALSSISQGSPEAAQAIINYGIVNRLVQLLSLTSVQKPALCVIGNLLMGDETQTQVVIDAGVLQPLLSLLVSPKHQISRPACWSISNITAGTVPQVQAVIDAGIIPPLLDLLTRSDFRMRREAAWAISNATYAGLSQPDQIRYLVQKGCVEPLVNILQTSDNNVINIVLNALDNILRVGEIDKGQDGHGNRNQYAQLIEEAGGVYFIHNLQKHENSDIYNKCFSIMEKYFPDDDDDEDNVNQDVQDAQVNVQGNFTFNSDVSVPQGGFVFS